MKTFILRSWRWFLSVICLIIIPALPGQTVFSVNALGYADFSLSAGSNFITQPFQKQDHTVARLLQGLPDGSRLQVWDPALRDFGPTNHYSVSNGWSQPELTLAYPQGALLWVPAPTQLHFSGEVFQGAVTGRTYQAGLYLLGMFPATGWIFCASFTECPQGAPPVGTTLCLWNRSLQRCENYTYYGPEMGAPSGWYNDFFEPATPSLEPGESGWFLVNESFSALAPLVGDPPLPGPRLQQVRRNGDEFQLELQVEAGKLFQIERSTDLSSEVWEPVMEGTGQGGVSSVVLSNQTLSAAFYRMASGIPRGSLFLFGESRTNQQFSFRFNAPTGQVYRVERTPNLPVTAPWQTIATVTVTNPGTVRFTDTNAVAARGYYRVSFAP